MRRLGEITVIAGLFALTSACGPSELQSFGDGSGTGDPTDPDDPTYPGGGGGGGTDDPGTDICEDSTNAGQDCEVTADCPLPYVCLDGLCVAPQDPAYHCDPIEGIYCAHEDEVCVAGVCVVNPGDCVTVDDCPNGFDCVDGVCLEQGTGLPCSDPGPGPSLTDTWNFQSTLHLREGLPGVVDGLLDVSELLADFIEGDVDLGLPSAVEALIGYMIADLIDQHVPQWAQDLIVGLAGVSDVLDDLEVVSVVWLDGQVCEANYRGSSRWEWITFEYRGTVVTERPDDIPEIGEVRPEDFGAVYSCGKLYIDKHRIKNVVGGLVNYIVNTIVAITTPYNNVEDALNAAINCGQIAQSINNAWQSACDCSTSVTSVVQSTCEAYKDDLIDEVVQALEDATVGLSVLSMKGVAVVPDGHHLTQGRWYGSIFGGDFPGEFYADTW